MKIDESPYGRYESSKKLRKIVIEIDNPAVQRRVGKMYSYATRSLNVIAAKIHDDKLKILLIELFVKFIFDKIDNTELPAIVASYLKNVIVTESRGIKLEAADNICEITAQKHRDGQALKREHALEKLKQNETCE